MNSSTFFCCSSDSSAPVTTSGIAPLLRALVSGLRGHSSPSLRRHDNRAGYRLIEVGGKLEPARSFLEAGGISPPTDPSNRRVLFFIGPDGHGAPAAHPNTSRRARTPRRPGRRERRGRNSTHT